MRCNPPKLGGYNAFLSNPKWVGVSLCLPPLGDLPAFRPTDPDRHADATRLQRVDPCGA